MKDYATYKKAAIQEFENAWKELQDNLHNVFEDGITFQDVVNVLESIGKSSYKRSTFFTLFYNSCLGNALYHDFDLKDYDVVNALNMLCWGIGYNIFDDGEANLVKITGQLANGKLEPESCYYITTSPAMEIAKNKLIENSMMGSGVWKIQKIEVGIVKFKTYWNILNAINDDANYFINKKVEDFYKNIGGDPMDCREFKQEILESFIDKWYEVK